MKKDINILVLEDYAPDADLMIHELRRAGFKPEWQRIQTEEEFVDSLDNHWDLILADFTLPQFDAISALEILRENGQEIPLIIVTGTISEEAALRCIEMGAADYLLKDRLTRLAAAVQHVLEEQYLREAKERTEEALVQSEERFYRLAENATDIFCNIRVSPDLHVDYINPAIVRALGYSPQEVIENPQGILDKVNPGQRQALIDALQDHVAYNQPFLFQWQAKDESWRWIECSAVAIRDKFGQLAALEVVGRDVSRRVEAELALQEAHHLLEQRVEERTQELRQSEERFRIALANAPIVVATTDKNLRYTWVYKGGAVKDVATVGKTYEELLRLEDVAELVDLKREVLNKGKAVRREIRIRMDGDDRYYDAFVEPLRDASGAVIGLTSARMDITDRKKWEHILFDATQRLEQHMNNSPLAILEFDPEYRITRWNDGAERMFQYTAAEVIGKKLSELNFLHEDDLDSIYKAIGIKGKSGVARTYNENRNYRKDGSIVYCQWYNSVLLDEHGEPRSILAQGLDVTERKRAEVELLAAKERLTTILESITNAFMSLDTEFRFTYVNQTAADMTRQEISNMIGRNIWDVFPEAQGSRFQEMYEKSLRENVSLRFEEYYAPLDAWYEVICYPSSEGLSIFFDDISSRKYMLDHLRESEERFRQIAENMHEVVWMIDVETEQYLYVSPNAEAVMGLKAWDAYAGNFSEIIHPEDRERILGSREKVLKGEYDEEFRIIKPGGEIVWLRGRTFPIHNAEGEVYRVVGISEDITDFKRYEEQRERLASIVNASGDAIARVTLEGIITDWNHGAEMTYGWSAEEAIGQSVFDLIVPPEEKAATLKIIGRVAKGKALEVETQRVCRDGRRIDIAMTISPIRDSAGNVVALSKIERDITQRKMAEEALWLSEERFHVALGNSPITVFHQDPQLRFTWVHNLPDAMPPEGIIGKSIFEVFPKEEAQKLAELSQQVLQSGVSGRCESKMIVAGQLMDFDMAIEPLRDRGGAIIGLTGAAIDITARKHSEEQLAQQNLEIQQERERLRTVLNVLPVAVFIADASGKILESNEAARILWGGDTPLVEIEKFDLYKGWFVDTRKRLKPKDWAMAQALLTGKEPFPQELEIECFDGTRKTVINAAQPILDANGNVTGAVSVLHDITERRRLFEQLSELNEQLELRVHERTRYIDLLRTVTQIANESDNLQEALQKTLDAVCEKMHWVVGHAFTFDEETQRFRDTGIWSLPTDPTPFKRLIEVTESFECSAYAGMIGEALTSNAPKWVFDVKNSDEFLRNQAGEDLGVVTAMAFPVSIEKQAVAVFEFFCETPHEPDEAELELMANIGVQFGRVIERERLQHRITQAVLNEQRRLGHELHDTVGQQLAGLAMTSKTLFHRLQREGSAEAEMIQNVVEQLRDAVIRVRAIARGLFPVETDVEGLKAALVDLAQQTRERFKIECECHFIGAAIVSDNDTANHLYRIAQEAVSNAIRHGKPTRITITLEAEGRSFRLQVENDGKPIDVDSQTGRSGIGLSIMRHRARMIHASLEIRSASEQGVIVVCTREEGEQHGQG